MKRSLEYVDAKVRQATGAVFDCFKGGEDSVALACALAMLAGRLMGAAHYYARGHAGQRSELGVIFADELVAAEEGLRAYGEALARVEQ